MIGLIPDMENKVTFFLTEEDGSTDTKEIVFEMGSLIGTERCTDLDTDVAAMQAAGRRALCSLGK